MKLGDISPECPACGRPFPGRLHYGDGDLQPSWWVCLWCDHRWDAPPLRVSELTA